MTSKSSYSTPVQWALTFTAHLAYYVYTFASDTAHACGSEVFIVAGRLISSIWVGRVEAVKRLIELGHLIKSPSLWQHCYRIYVVEIVEYHSRKDLLLIGL